MGGGGHPGHFQVLDLSIFDDINTIYKAQNLGTVHPWKITTQRRTGIKVKGKSPRWLGKSIYAPICPFLILEFTLIRIIRASHRCKRSRRITRERYFCRICHRNPHPHAPIRVQLVDCKSVSRGLKIPGERFIKPEWERGHGYARAIQFYFCKHRTLQMSRVLQYRGGVQYPDPR